LYDVKTNQRHIEPNAPEGDDGKDIGMLLFGSRKSKVKMYDHDTQEPVIRASICNGEQVAGFRDIKTGRFEEILYIRKPSDLETFKAEYGIEGEIRKEY